MDNNIKISIIIPVYNVENYISHCLKSLLNQGIDEHTIEILVIDDGSKDNSIKIAKEFQKLHLCIKIYTQENGGVGSARNKGIDLANGEYIYFIDPDDYLVDNGLKIVLKHVKNINIDVVCFKSLSTREYNLNRFTEDIQLEDYHFDFQEGLIYIGKQGFKNEVWWYLIKREFLQRKKIKFIEGRWMEDAIFTANLFVNASAVYLVPITIHRHVVVLNSAMTNKEPEHYKKVIYDNANAAVEYDRLIKNVPNIEKYAEGIKRLNIRKQSFVFFLIIRIIRSKIAFYELYSILKKMETIGAYPISKSFLIDYKGLNYKILRIILNNKLLLYFMFKLFKLF